MPGHQNDSSSCNSFDRRRKIKKKAESTMEPPSDVVQVNIMEHF